MKRYMILEKAMKWTAIIGVIFFAISITIWCEGVKSSQYTQIMAEYLGKNRAGEGLYPKGGTDYVLEARIVGQEGWVSKAVNIDFGEQVEFRLCIASGEGVGIDNGAPPFIHGVGGISRSVGLEEAVDKDGKTINIRSYESPDVRHVVYVPLGVYTVDYSKLWSDNPKLLMLEVYYIDVDSIPCRDEIWIVPPYSKVNYRAVLGFALAGLVCLLAALSIGLVRRI